MLTDVTVVTKQSIFFTFNIYAHAYRHIQYLVHSL